MHRFGLGLIAAAALLWPVARARAQDMGDMPGMDMSGMHHDHDHPDDDAGAGLTVPFATPREMLIPGRPGPTGMVHVMLNAFAELQNTGAGDDTQPLLIDDWVMAYARDRHGWLEALVMLDLEPFTIGAGGYPELGQAGEGLYDAQHAHQLFHQVMLAVHPIPELSIFGGQGSATIGPPLFMHRASSPGPTVPRKHHKGENPHETFPVLGASLHVHGLWIEASLFSALELTPDDSRFYPHLGTVDSFAARLRWDATDWLELQISGERLNDQGHGAPDAWQASASAYAYGRFHGWRLDGLLDWAVDVPDGESSAQALVLEAAARTPDLRDVFWMRSEFNQREEAPGAPVAVSSPWLFETLGFERVAWTGHGLELGLFGEATLVHIPGDLSPIYGRDLAATVTVGLHVFGMWML